MFFFAKPESLSFIAIIDKEMLALVNMNQVAPGGKSPSAQELRPNANKKMYDRETMFSHAAQAAAETFAASLEPIGLVLADGWNGEGALFEGDGCRCEGWYWAWEARRFFSVVCCDFTLKEPLPFCFDSGGYFAVRRERHGLMPQSSVSAFLEAKPKTSSILLPKEARFSYTEIEYYDEYCQSVFGERIDKALKPLATSLKGLRNQASWDPEIAEMLGEITPREIPGPEASLLYSGIANLVMARLLRMGESLCEGVAEQDRLSIARAVSYIENNLGGAIRQKDLLEAANMGSTKFKKTFKQVTGLTVTEFVSSERIELAKRLLTDHDMSIDEVAHRCGYARATSFSALFAKSVGMPPRKWRSIAKVAFDDDPESKLLGVLASGRSCVSEAESHS